MAFIKVGSGTRINIDAITYYSAGTCGGQPMTGISLTGMGSDEMPLFTPETPEEIDALIDAGTGGGE